MTVTIHTDGGSRGNPGQSATGVVIEAGSELLFEEGVYIGVCTNNVAEYKAVIAGLEWLTHPSITIESAQFFLDSQLVVSQLNGVYQVKHPEMKLLKRKTDQLITSLPFPITFQYVPRAQNKRADELVNEALDKISQSR